MTCIAASFLVNKQTTCSSIAARIFWSSGLGELVWQEVKNHARKIGQRKVFYLQIHKGLNLRFFVKLILNICMCCEYLERHLYYIYSGTAYKCIIYLLFHDFTFPYLYFDPPISCVLVKAEDLEQLSWGDRLALGRLGCKFYFYHKLCLILASSASSLSWFSFCLTK